MKALVLALLVSFLGGVAQAASPVEVCEFQWPSYFSSKRLTVYTNGWTVNLCFYSAARSTEELYVYECKGVPFTQPDAQANAVYYHPSTKRVALGLPDNSTLICAKR